MKIYPTEYIKEILNPELLKAFDDHETKLGKPVDRLCMIDDIIWCTGWSQEAAEKEMIQVLLQAEKDRSCY